MVFSLDQSCSSYLSLFFKHPYVSDLTSTILSLVHSVLTSSPVPYICQAHSQFVVLPSAWN